MGEPASTPRYGWMPARWRKTILRRSVGCVNDPPLIRALHPDWGARRLGSVRQLQWTDFDFERDTVRWRAAADKKGKEWEIPLTPDLREE